MNGMLILDREAGDSVMIGDNVEVVVVDVTVNDNGKLIARLGIKAPKEVKVFRREIYDRMPGKKSRCAT